MDEVRLALCPNNVAVNEACPLCGRRNDPGGCGYDVFLMEYGPQGWAEAWPPVCETCIQEHAPELIPARDGAADAWWDRVNGSPTDA